VAAIKPLGLLGGNEELRSISVFASISHGQPSGSVVLQLEVLIVKLVSIDGFAACSITASEVTALDHEVADDTVELAPLVSECGASTVSLRKKKSLDYAQCAVICDCGKIIYKL
jgi:hypothetical protein